MSVAFYITLDKKDVDFETFVDGKSIAKVFDELIIFSQSNGLKSFEDYFYQDLSEFEEEFEGLDILEQIEPWYDAEEGISWVTDMINSLKIKSPEFATKYVIDDFKCYLDIFNYAKKIDAKWHLSIDI